MPTAGAQAFTAVTEFGAAATRSHAIAAEGAVLASRRVAVRRCSPSGIRPTRATTGKTGAWVRRQLR
jgi:hypothetical protein